MASSSVLRWRVGGIFAAVVALLTAAASGQAHPPLHPMAILATPTQTVLAFNPVAVGVSLGSAQQLTATFTVSGYSGTSFTPTAALHYGLHYSAAAIQCTGGASPETCTVTVSFVPTMPGGRKDALVLSSGTTELATTLLWGVGQSPFGLIQPGVITHPITLGPDYLYQMAVDENGTVYITGNNSNTLTSVTAAGVVTALPATLSSPLGIDVDGTGTLYIGNNGYGHAITTYSAQAGQGSVTVTPTAPYVPCSNSNPGDLELLGPVAVDGLGDLFAVEQLCQQVFELEAGGTYHVTDISPAITQPYAMTVDYAGDTFVGGYTINEITAAATQSEINTTGASQQLATDPADTLYATRYTGSGGVVELAVSSYAAPIAALDSTASPLGATVAPDGTVYVANYNTLDRVDRSQGAIAFGEQTAGVTSTAEDVSLYNGGNEPLTLSTLVIAGTGFAFGTAATSNCTAGLVLQPGTLCNAAVTLTAPHAGTFSGTLTFTSNSLNATKAQNVVALSGFVYGVYVTPAPAPLVFAPQTVNTTSGPQGVTLTNSGDLYTAGIGAPSSNNTAFAVTLGTCTTGVAVGASCALAVTFDPTLAQSYSGTVSLSVSSSGGGPAQMVSFTVEGQGVPVSAPDAGSDASTGITDAAADVAEASVTVDAGTTDAASGPEDASPDTSTEPAEASTDAATEPLEASMDAAAPDTSTGEMDAAVTQDATTGSDGAVEDAEPGADAEFTVDGADVDAAAGFPGEKPGCSCRAAGAHDDATLWPLGALVAMFTLRRRRRAAAGR